MRWILRVLATLIIAPPLYHLVLVYLASQQGQDIGTLLQASLAALEQYYVAFSAPALALIVLVLTPAEILLRRWGLLLMTVLASPLLAWPAALAFAYFIQDADAKGKAGLVAIAVTYGLVWGLSVRETRRRVEPVAVADDKPIADRPAVDTPVVETGTQVAAIVAANLAAVKPDTAPSWADREPAPAAPIPEATPDPTKPPLFLPRAKRQGRPAPANVEADREPNEVPKTTPPTTVGDVVARNMREAAAAARSGATANKVAAVVAANAAAAAARAPADPQKPAAAGKRRPADAQVRRDVVAEDTPPAGPGETIDAPRPSLPERTATEAVGGVVAANAAEAAARSTPDTRPLGDRITDYWTRSGGAAKPARKETGVADKVAEYRRRIEGRDPAPPAAAPSRTDEASPSAKVDEIVAANFAEAAKASDVAAPAKPARRDAPPPQAHGDAKPQGDAAGPAPSAGEEAATPSLAPEAPDKRMPRTKPGLELNHRNPLIDRIDAERRKPR